MRGMEAEAFLGPPPVKNQLFYGETLAVLTRSVKQGLGAEAVVKDGIKIKISKNEFARIFIGPAGR